MSDRAVEVVRASDAEELLPRVAQERTSVLCRGGSSAGEWHGACAWQDRCWGKTVSEGPPPEARRRRHPRLDLASGRDRARAAGPALRAAGRNPRQPALACPTRPLAAARGRAARLRARLRGGRSRTRRGDQGLHQSEAARHDRLHPVRHARPRPSREIKDWFENRTARAAGVPAVRLCRYRKEHGAAFALDELGLEPHQRRARRRDCVPGVVTATFTGKAALVLTPQGHAGPHHPQPDLQRARGDRGGGRGGGRRRSSEAENEASAP